MRVKKSMILKIMMCVMFFMLMLVFSPIKISAAMDTQTNQTVIELLQQDSQETITKEDGSNTKLDGKLPQTSEVKSFLLSFLGTLCVSFVFFIRRRKQNEQT